MSNTELIVWNTDFNAIPESKFSDRFTKESEIILATFQAPTGRFIEIAHYQEFSDGTVMWFTRDGEEVFQMSQSAVLLANTKFVAWAELPKGYTG